LHYLSGHQAIQCIVNLPQARLKQLSALVWRWAKVFEQRLANVFAFSVQLVPDESFFSSNGNFNQLNCVILVHHDVCPQNAQIL